MLDNNWYKKHLKQIKKKAWPRYTPELNIKLPISDIFDGISRTENFYISIRKKYGEFLREFKHISSKYEDVELQKAYDLIKKEADLLFRLIEIIKDYNTVKIPWQKIKNKTKYLGDKLWKFADQLRLAKEQVKEIKLPARSDGSYQPSPSEKLNYDIHYIYETQQLIHYFEELSSSTQAQLSNHPFLLLTGSAGTGKTHLLCDIVEQRIQDKIKILPSFLLFSEFFTDKRTFWDQVFEHLEIKNFKNVKEVFLKEINNVGEKTKSRALFIIDALNENIMHAPNFWKNNLDNIIKDIKKYPNIALIVSVRKGFEKEVLTETQKKAFILQEHYGFRFKEWEAINKFFKTFKLPLPEIPLLIPEFQNPLFLLLFCKAFQNRKNKKNKQIFRGHEGSTYIFETYIDNISRPIEKKFKIDNGPKKNIWDTVIEKIAEEMVNQNEDRITEEKLLEIIQKTHTNIDSRNLVQSLESDILIVKVPRYNNNDKRINGFDIRFPFQKFSDHLIGRYIFKKYENEFGKTNKNLGTAKKFFSKKRKLGKLLFKSWNRGIIDALSIQCPEQLNGIEFFEVIPFLQEDSYLYKVAMESFVESLIWRNPKAFSVDRKNTLKIINQNIIRTKAGHNQLLDAFLSVAPIPNHPFNAEFLNKHLSKFSMPKRDSWWSTFLHYQYGEHGAIDRLIEWSWSDQDYTHINDKSIFLTCIALSWFLTTSNRLLRDKATKGLVCLLQKRIHLLSKLLEKFKDVNDLYVIERLFAVSYGCVLRNQKDIDDLIILAGWVYENIFKDNKPPVHILLRDYARGIIEVALKKGVKIKINEKLINPPYSSKWPQKIPTEGELKKKYYPEDFFKDKTKDRGFLDIWSSVMHDFGTLGDFGNYVVNSHLHCWTGVKIGEKAINKKKLYENFISKLSSKQKKLWDNTNPIIYEKNKTNTLPITSGITINLSIAKGRKTKKELKIASESFIKSLNPKQKKTFNTEIKPFLDHNQNIYDTSKNFDTRLAQRWIFNHVVELGYNPELHGEFDNMVNRFDNTGRSEHKAERIGKKYQWISHHEFMALVSDHFKFKGDSWNESIEEYKGPWNPYVRDIDPSFILKDDSHIKESTTFSNWKSSHGRYNAWGKTKSNIDWIKTDEELPEPKNIIQIMDDNKKELLVLEGFVKWEEKTQPEYKKYDIPVREVWYMIKSYIAKKKDAKKFFTWAKKQDFMGRWMPESYDFYEVFLGEYPNSLAFDDLRESYNIWTKSGRRNQDLPFPVIVTDDSYLNEFTLDYSHIGSVSVKLPCKWLINEMNLNHKYQDGRFYDINDNLVTINTSIFEENFFSALLINKKAILEYLNSNDYIIFWTLLGEKQLIGGNFSGKDFIGRLEINGYYILDNDGKINGEFHNKFNK